MTPDRTPSHATAAIPRALAHFDTLPDAACVRRIAVAQIRDRYQGPIGDLPGGYHGGVFSGPVERGHAAGIESVRG